MNQAVNAAYIPTAAIKTTCQTNHWTARAIWYPFTASHLTTGRQQ